MTELIPQTHRTRPDFFEDPASAIIGAAGLVFPPAFYLWIAPQAHRHRERLSRAEAQLRVAALRRHLARKACFVR